MKNILRKNRESQNSCKKNGFAVEDNNISDTFNKNQGITYLDNHEPLIEQTEPTCLHWSANLVDRNKQTCKTY